jgi:hypothetical protein
VAPRRFYTTAAPFWSIVGASDGGDRLAAGAGEAMARSVVADLANADLALVRRAPFEFAPPPPPPAAAA